MSDRTEPTQFGGEYRYHKHIDTKRKIIKGPSSKHGGSYKPARAGSRRF